MNFALTILLQLIIINNDKIKKDLLLKFIFHYKLL